MFDSVDEMVEENDRRHLDGGLGPEDIQEPSLQYASCLCLCFTTILHILPFNLGAARLAFTEDTNSLFDSSRLSRQCL